MIYASQNWVIGENHKQILFPKNCRFLYTYGKSIIAVIEETLTWLEDYLATYKGALLIVSHDRYFLDKLCNKIWEMEDGELREYKGNYTAYCRQREEQDSRQRKLMSAQQ